jgi:hypothetical protein
VEDSGIGIEDKEKFLKLFIGRTKRKKVLDLV